MNKQDRKALNALAIRLEEIMQETSMLAIAEREKFDNMPDSLQLSERGQEIELAAETLDELVSTLETALDYFVELE